jgi:hypothetical protein
MSPRPTFRSSPPGTSILAQPPKCYRTAGRSQGLWWIAAGIVALGAYGFVATFQPDPNFGRILAAYGGIFVADRWPGAS